MIKPIKLRGNSLQIKAKCLMEVCFGGCSDSELQILAYLIQFSTGNSITLTVDLSRQIKASAGVGDSSFSTSLFRLEKKGVLTRLHKTVNLHPAFNNLQDVEKLMISFVDVEENKKAGES